MLIWTTTQIFQQLFGVQVSGDAAMGIQLFGFMEILIELFALATLVAFFISELLTKEKK